MKSWEMIIYLEDSYKRLERGEVLSGSEKSILGAMKWQSLEQREKTAHRILASEGYKEEFIRHAARMLDVPMKYQRRLF